MIDQTPKHQVRFVKEADHSFIHDAWWKTMRPMYPFTDGQLLKQAISSSVDKSLRAGEETNLVLTDDQDPEHIYAFLLWHEVTPQICAVDFAYTRNSMRRFGFQRELMQATSHYPHRVLTFQAPSFSMKEFFSSNEAGVEPFGFRLKNKHGVVIDPFFYERMNLVGYGEKR